jgi:hypothetical protein
VVITKINLLTHSVFLYVLPVLTFRNPTVCPQCAFMSFAWISEQAGIFTYTNMTGFYNQDEVCLLVGTS